jgi:hypothetical protein
MKKYSHSERMERIFVTTPQYRITQVILQNQKSISKSISKNKKDFPNDTPTQDHNSNPAKITNPFL